MALSYAGGTYRDGDDSLTDAELTARRDAQIDAWGEELARIATDALGTGATVSAIEFPTSRIEAFAARFLAKAQDILISAYVFARGGIGRMGDADWPAVAELVDRQRGFGVAFVDEVKTGLLSAAQIVARSATYSGAAVSAFEAGRAALLGIDLPALPADGSQQCLARCRCSWSITELSDRWEAVWTLNAPAVHCETCLANAGTWAPFVQMKDEG